MRLPRRSVRSAVRRRLPIRRSLVQQRPGADQHHGSGFVLSNGINPLNGDTLKLIFNETGRSTLSISDMTFNTAGFGLSMLTAGTDFLDSNPAIKFLSSHNAASTTPKLGSIFAR
jgi:hypothetical protein